MEVKASISIERTLGPLSSLSSTEGPKLRHIVFIIIESGMALFAIQLVCVVITSLIELHAAPTPQSLLIDSGFVISIHQMLNVIIISVHLFLVLFY